MVSRRTRARLRKELIGQDKIVRQELHEEAEDTARILAAELREVVAQWKNKPKFNPAIEINPKYIIATVKIAGDRKARQIFGWVDRGTGKWGKKKAAYPITPKEPGGMLRFQRGYSPRTKPVAQYNVGSGKSFGAWVASKGVMHPGIEPREFTATFDAILKVPMKTRIHNALRRAERRIKR